MKANLRLLHFLLLVALITSGCLVSKPHLKTSSVPNEKTGYVEVQTPYYKKHVNGLGGFFTVSFTGAGGYLGYQYTEDKNQYLYAAGGAVGGYLVSRLFLLIGGNHKKTYLKSADEVPQWVQDYNRFRKKDWILTSFPPPTATTVKVLPASMEARFFPSDLSDVRNFAAAFPNSPRIDAVIDSASTRINSVALSQMISLFENRPVIIHSKTEFVRRSSTEEELLFNLNLFPDTEPYVEKDYAALVKSFRFAKDFIGRYPKSRYANEVFGRVWQKVSNNELEFLIDNFHGVDTALMSKSRKHYISRIDSFDLALAKVRKYDEHSYIVQPGDNYEDAESAYNLYQKLTSYEGSEHKARAALFITELKKQFLKAQLAGAKGSIEDTRDLYKFVNSTTWIKGTETEFITDDITAEYAYSLREELFTGKRIAGVVQGPGKLFTVNGDMENGNFRNGKLAGMGLIRRKSGEVLEGNFENGELSGEGKVTQPSGMVTQGFFSGGDLEGKGRISYADGAYEMGTYHFNRLEGEGERKFKDSSYYKGSFQGARFSGPGRFTWNEKEVYFEGSFADGKREGEGTLFLPGGMKIKGNWKNDCPDGELQVEGSAGTLGSLSVHDCKIQSSGMKQPLDKSTEQFLFRKLTGF
jgi:translation initiation factor IF-1